MFNMPEVLSMALGAGETSLINLTQLMHLLLTAEKSKTKFNR